jgi:endonuclease/exonuclease/phosphatase family metal-dependent hydrolase
MTFNIWNYNRPWQIRRRLIAELIVAHEPDVVALQETRHDRRFERGKGQGEQLAELTGYHLTSAVAQVYVPLWRVDEGLTILTRRPPARTMLRRLTINRRDRQDENHRICLGVTLEEDGHPFDVYDAHFSLSETARCTNALEVAQFVEQESVERPAVLMGDLNAEPDAPPIRFLLGQQPLNGITADFVDCWQLANPGQPGYTYASFDPVRRIDYVLGRNLPAGVTSATVIGGQAVEGVYPSDHMGIVVEIPS